MPRFKGLKIVSFALVMGTCLSSKAVTVAPTATTAMENASVQFTANALATWTTDCGSISSAGMFKAPLYPKLCTVKATAIDGSGSASTTVNVVSPIVMTPVSATTPQGQTKQFAASVPVTWVAKCGTITAGGLFTASGTVGTYCTIQGTATSSPKYTVYGYDKIGPPGPAPLSISPLNPILASGGTQQFTASANATFSASCGTITAGGFYNAPSTSMSCTIAAQATDGSGRTAFTIAAVSPALVISPANASLFAIGTQQFTANLPVTWSSTCGNIVAGTGLFTAPSNTADCTVTATTTSGPPATGTASVSISIINFTTFQGNNSRTGAQQRERTLTPANVNSSHFGLAWSMKLDGGIWTQPLYMNALSVNGTAHNVVFETTANNSVYAIDADSGTLLWQRSFLSPGVTAVAGSSIHTPMTPVGIVGTPVIDPNTNSMYVVTMTAENNNTLFIHRLHAIDITTGSELPNSPVAFVAAGFGDVKQMQRAALLLANGRVYVAFGSIQDILPYQGFVFAFDAASLALVNVFGDDPTDTTNGGGGIWAPSGPSADEDGNIYVSSGNGGTDGIQNFGQSIIKLSPSLDVLDYFTPFDHVAQSAADLDLGSGGVLVVPEQTGAIRHELIVCGKPTPIYVLNRDQLGGTGSASDNIIQRLDNQLGQTGSFNASGEPCFFTPAIWNQNVYFVANHDVMKMFTLDGSTGLLSTAPVSKGSTVYTYPGAYPAVSSNGNSDGIVWTYEPTSGTLRATDATDVSKELFVGAVFTGSKWSVPTIVNGHVYIETQNRIFAFAPH